MPIEVTCDSCTNSYRVKDDRAGTTIKCKVCGARVEVPDDDAEDEELPVSRRPSSRKGSSKKRSASAAGTQQTLLIASVGGIVALGLVGVLIFTMTRGPAAKVAENTATEPPSVAPAAPGFPNGAVPAVPVVAGTPLPPGVATPPGTSMPPGMPPTVPGTPTAAGPPTQNDTNWQVQVDASTTGFTWADDVKLDIPIPGDQAQLFFPTTESPFVLLGTDAYASDRAQLWNLATGKQVGQIRGKPSTASRRAVSPDGKYLAIAVLNKEQRCIVELWSLETGNLIRTITDDQASLIAMLDFGPDNLLFYYVVGPVSQGPRIKLWDVTKGTFAREIPTKFSIDENRCGLSPGRRFLANVDSSHKLSVIDLVTGNIAGTANLPKSSDLEPYLSPECVRFSHDGSRIHVLANGQSETRIMTLDSKTGQRDPETDIAFPGRLLGVIHAAAAYKGPKLECLSNGGFLIAGNTWVDGDSGRVVWYLDFRPDQYEFERRIPVPNGLIGTVGDYSAKRLVVLESPWTAIRTSLKAIEAGAPAAVRPGQPVSLDIQVGALQHGTPEETKASLTEVLTERLAAVGIEVKEGQPTVLRIAYKEAAGNKLQESVRNRNDPLGIRGGTLTGREIQATMAEMTVSWIKEMDKKPLWTRKIEVNPNSLFINGEITPEKARTAMFEDLKNTLVSQPLPYFIPDDKKLAQLPGATPVGDPKTVGKSRAQILLDAAKKRKKP